MSTTEPVDEVPALAARHRVYEFPCAAYSIPGGSPDHPDVNDTRDRFRDLFRDIRSIVLAGKPAGQSDVPENADLDVFEAEVGERAAALRRFLDERAASDKEWARFESAVDSCRAHVMIARLAASTDEVTGGDGFGVGDPYSQAPVSVRRAARSTDMLRRAAKKSRRRLPGDPRRQDLYDLRTFVNELLVSMLDSVDCAVGYYEELADTASAAASRASLGRTDRPPSGRDIVAAA